MVNTTPLCVLVVEDDADTRANVCDILDLDGHRVITASTFAKALDRDNWDDISAILLDRKLPDGDAEEMMPRIRQLAPEVPIVVMTGYPDVQGAIAALRQGAYDYILKPINADALRASLRRIAERNEAAEALRREHELSENLINIAPNIVLILNTEGRIVRFNPYMEDLTGWRLDEVQGRDWFETFLPARERPRIRKIFHRSLAGQRTNGVVNAIVTKDGREREIEWYDAPLSSPEGKQTGMLCTGQDITERRRLVREILEIAAEEDRRIGQELHDNVQQELTGLGMFAQNLAETLAQRSAPEAPLAARLAKGIRETSRDVHLLARGLIPVEIDAQGLMAALDQLAAKTGEMLEVPCVFQCNEPVELAGSFAPTHLYRIAQEAVTNAVKHGQADRILISLAKSDGCLTLSVLDNGIGIDDKHLSGLGMGLRIMDYRAGLIGGSLEVAPGEEGGTRVTCTMLQT